MFNYRLALADGHIEVYVVVWAVLCGSVFLPVNRNANNSNLRRKKDFFFF